MNRLAGISCLLLLLFPASPVGSQSEEEGADAYFFDQALDPGQRLQLFLHSYAWADRWEVGGKINEPAKHPDNPVLMADQPWEHSVGLPNVLYDRDRGLFRMWYALYDITKWGGFKARLQAESGWKRHSYMISYAESRDGVRWTKPLPLPTPSNHLAFCPRRSECCLEISSMH